MTDQQTYIEKATTSHLERLIKDGTVTIGKPDNPRDIRTYLQSSRFTQFIHSVRMAVDNG